MQRWMATTPRRSARRLLRCTSGVVAAAALVVGGPAATALADGGSRTTVTGQLVRAWPEAATPETAAGEAAEAPLAFVQTGDGDSVRVSAADVDGVPSGTTLQVTVGAPVDDTASTDAGYEPA